MKKKILPVILWIVLFAASFVFLSYVNPIKLSAEPWEYFIENLKHMASLKIMISIIISAAVTTVVQFLTDKRGTVNTED